MSPSTHLNDHVCHVIHLSNNHLTKCAERCQHSQGQLTHKGQAVAARSISPFTRGKHPSTGLTFAIRHAVLPVVVEHVAAWKGASLVSGVPVPIPWDVTALGTPFFGILANVHLATADLSKTIRSPTQKRVLAFIFDGYQGTAQHHARVGCIHPGLFVTKEQPPHRHGLECRT